MPCFLAIDFCNLILLYYTAAKAKARVTGMRETFLPWARTCSSPSYFLLRKIMAKIKEISVFVDESGSFSPLEADPESPYYLKPLFRKQWV